VAAWLSDNILGHINAKLLYIEPG